MLPPTGPQAAKRLLSKPGTASKFNHGVRGELLSNGYKSLRAQGMLRVNKLGDNGASAELTSDKKQRMGSRKKSKEIEHVNICIEKRTTYPDEQNDLAMHHTYTKKTSQTGQKERKASSPIKVNPNLVPKGLGPVKDRQFAKLRSSQASRESSHRQQPTH